MTMYFRLLYHSTFFGFKKNQNLQSFVPRITVLNVSNWNHPYWELETVALEYLSPKICKLVPSHLSHSKPGACLLVPLTEFRNIICALETRACQIKLTCTYKLCIRYFCLSIFLLFFQISTAEWLSHQLSVSTPNIPLYHRCTTISLKNISVTRTGTYTKAKTTCILDQKDQDWWTPGHMTKR